MAKKKDKNYIWIIAILVITISVVGLGFQSIFVPEPNDVILNWNGYEVRARSSVRECTQYKDGGQLLDARFSIDDTDQLVCWEVGRNYNEKYSGYVLANVSGGNLNLMTKLSTSNYGGAGGGITALFTNMNILEHESIYIEGDFITKQNVQQGGSTSDIYWRVAQPSKPNGLGTPSKPRDCFIVSSIERPLAGQSTPQGYGNQFVRFTTTQEQVVMECGWTECRSSNCVNKVVFSRSEMVSGEGLFPVLFDTTFANPSNTAWTILDKLEVIFPNNPLDINAVEDDIVNYNEDMIIDAGIDEINELTAQKQAEAIQNAEPTATTTTTIVSEPEQRVKLGLFSRIWEWLKSLFTGRL